MALRKGKFTTGRFVRATVGGDEANLQQSEVNYTGKLASGSSIQQDVATKVELSQMVNELNQKMADSHMNKVDVLLVL